MPFFNLMVQVAILARSLGAGSEEGEGSHHLQVWIICFVSLLN